MVRDMVDAVDDGDGFIDYEEFKKMIMKYQYKHFKCKSLKINIDIVMPSPFMQFQINIENILNKKIYIILYLHFYDKTNNDNCR